MRQLMLCVYKWCWAKKKTFFLSSSFGPFRRNYWKIEFSSFGPKTHRGKWCPKIASTDDNDRRSPGQTIWEGGSRNPGPDSKTGHCATGPQRIRRANRKTSLALWPNYRTILIVVRTRDGSSRDSQSLIRTDSPNLHPQEPRQSRLSRRTTQLV